MDTSFPVYAWTGSEQTVAELVFGLATLASLAYCARVAVLRRAVWPLAVFGGALLTVLYEPLNNVLAHCVWPEENQHTLFSLLGRDMPVVAVGVYTVYFAAPVVWLVQRFERGVTRPQLARWYAIGVLTAAAFEPVFCNGDIGLEWWVYYGDQALAFTGLPLFWWFANAMVLFACAAVVHLLRTQVFRADDWQSWAYVPAIPLTLFALHVSASMPMFISIGSGAGMAWITVATFMSIAISLACMALIVRVIGRPAEETAAEPAPAPGAPREVRSTYTPAST